LCSTSALSSLLCYLSFFYCVTLIYLHSFPTRRSSDLTFLVCCLELTPVPKAGDKATIFLKRSSFKSVGTSTGFASTTDLKDDRLDRKSTRLNSSHVSISYAVFCLKKKRYQDDGVGIT